MYWIYGSSPGVRIPEPRVKGTGVLVSSASKVRIARVSGYSSLRDSTSSNSDRTPENGKKQNSYDLGSPENEGLKMSSQFHILCGTPLEKNTKELKMSSQFHLLWCLYLLNEHLTSRLEVTGCLYSGYDLWCLYLMPQCRRYAWGLCKCRQRQYQLSLEFNIDRATE